MRSLFTLIACALISFTAIAQEKTDKSPKPPKKNREPLDKLIVDLNHDRWMRIPPGIDLKPWSYGINTNAYFDLPFGASPFSFAWGLGFTSHNVHSNGKVVYRLDASGKVFTAIEPITNDYIKNKLSLNYITLPVELRFRTLKKPKFRLFVGGKAGYLVNSHTKYVDDDIKIKVYRIKNVDPLMYGLTARIGIGRVQFTGYYSLTSVFERGKGEKDLIPYSVGINLIPFVK